MSEENLMPIETRLVAIDKEGMVTANKHLIAWAESKTKSLNVLIKDIEDNIEIAKKNRWRKFGLRNQLDRAKREQLWYGKLSAAIRAGYTVIPNFPCVAFAIRVTKDFPSVADSSSLQKWNANVKDEKAEELGKGEGCYVSPHPIVRTYSRTIDTQGKQAVYYTQEAIDLQDPLFPYSLAKPILLEETEKAMALKLFDEICASPDTRKKRDPLVLGRIICRTGQYTEKIATFIIGWYLNLDDLGR